MKFVSLFLFLASSPAFAGESSQDKLRFTLLGCALLFGALSLFFFRRAMKALKEAKSSTPPWQQKLSGEEKHRPSREEIFSPENLPADCPPLSKTMKDSP